MPVRPVTDQNHTVESNLPEDNENLGPSSDSDEDEQLSLQDRLFMLISSYHFTDTLFLRRIMRLTGAIVSGSAALAIIHPNQFIPNDLDFYVLPKGFAAVLKYVEDHGYKIQSDNDSDATPDYFHQSLVIVSLVHPISRKTVNVTTAAEAHVVKLISRFHSTLVMNYLAWFGLVVLYPEWTLKKHGLIITDTTPRTRRCLTKYVDRGYTFHHDVFQLNRPLEDHLCHVDPYCPNTKRSLHDGDCLVEPFDANDFDFKTVEHDMTWSLPVSCSLRHVNVNDIE